MIAFTLDLTPAELGYLVETLKARVDRIENTECNNPDVRLELYAEMASLRVILGQLGVGA